MFYKNFLRYILKSLKTSLRYTVTLLPPMSTSDPIVDNTDDVQVKTPEKKQAQNLCRSCVS